MPSPTLLNILPYSPKLKSVWDKAVDGLRQSTFLFQRDFMDYHSDRFQDRSLVVQDCHQRVVALLPACVHPTEAGLVVSHAGLTYGGLLTASNLGTDEVGEILRLALNFYREQGFRQLGYKPVPHIYHSYPAEEDLYWLFRFGAQLQGRSVSSVIDLRDPLKMSKLRRRKVHLAEREGGLIVRSSLQLLPAYWQLLDAVLQERHDTHPVHSLAEITRLAERFPKEIRLVTVGYAERPQEVLAGCLLFLTPSVAHVQYIAAGEEARQMGALDWLFDRIIREYAELVGGPRYLDFGTSVEQGGRMLNRGLIFQKEGFGGRAVCYDNYLLSL